jgi:hypothetical protein
MTVSRRAVLGGSLAVAVGLPTATAAAASAAAASPAVGAGVASASKSRRANLSHLDFLGDSVSPPAVPGHSSYGSGPLGVLWTYADRRADGTYARIGGGPYDAATDTYGQGAFNADDLARAAVVYLRHYRAHRDAHSRSAAYGLLRGLTYLQTTSGVNAGNVVLWMQPDGTLNPSAEPVELPDPSDSGPSYWLARTVWALGEGYEAFRTVDPAFARFLRTRLELAIAALDRQVLVHYGTWNVVDGRRVPAWLIVAGADATSEAVLGLSAYVRAGGSSRARQALARFAEAVAAMGAGGIREWPFRALLPWGESISDWHAWGAQMPSALAAASLALHKPGLLTPAIGDTAGFTPLLLTAGGPDNGWLPAPIDRTQIAYGVDARLHGLLGVASAGSRPGLRQVAAFVAAWYFGANRAREPVYDATTGRTYDGVSGDGVINRNSGAESTIHGLLSMLVLDRHPGIARLARTAGIVKRRGTLTLEAEDGVLAGNASATKPAELWTGESQFSGSGYAELGDGGSATLTLPRHPRSLVLPVVDLRPGSRAVTTFRGDDRVLGRVASGRIGRQGDSPAPGALLPVTVPRTLPATATLLSATTATAAGDPAVLDAVMLEPLVSRLVLRGDGGGTALLRSASRTAERTGVRVPGGGTARVTTYDGRGHLMTRSVRTGRTVRVTVPAGGFALVLR